MWNPLTPAEVIAAIGPAARDAARAGDLDPWMRGQLLSVYSGTRHLAAELGDVAPRVPEVARELAEAVRAGGLDDLAGALAAQTDPRVLAELTCQALDRLRVDDPRRARPLIQRALARAVALEIELLADAIEGPA